MSFDGRAFRDALGSFATGVCVITVNPDNEPAFGMTVNSFASVSLDPPLVLWSLQNDSECFPAFESNENFAVNILAANQQDLSNLYAKKGDHVLAQEHFELSEAGNPVINGAVTTFECKVWARYPGGDHVILVGEVIAMNTNAEKQPLLFNCGKYRELA